MTMICLDCRYIGPKPSGIAELVQAIVDHGPGLAPDLDFLFLRHRSLDRRLSTAPNVREIALATASNGPGTMWWLPELVDLSAVDLYHGPSNILPARLQMATVTTIHDMMWMTSPKLCDARARSYPSRAFFQHGIARALAKSTAITTVSAASRDAIAAWSPDAAARTHVTPSGVSEDFAPMTVLPGQLERLGIDAERRFVLTVGQYAPYKNHEGALRAFADAFGDDEAIDLVFVQRMGEGAQRLSRLAAELGVGHRVRFLKTIARADLVALYNSAAALLHPSFCEGFGNPLAEAMACGCPVVTSDISAMPEVTAGAARYASPYDIGTIAAALSAVVNDVVEAERLRQLGLARAARLSWRTFAQDIVKVYRQVLARSVRTP